MKYYSSVQSYSCLKCSGVKGRPVPIDTNSVSNPLITPELSFEKMSAYPSEIHRIVLTYVLAAGNAVTSAQRQLSISPIGSSVAPSYKQRETMII